MAIKGQSFLKAALLVAAGAGLSGCVYDVGLGFASDGYYDDAYGCDPYGGYDAYYNCDYSQAFSNIGFGGGWYDNYYYPGYGIFLFDTVGRRYPMREQYRRYWGERRHNWYREHRGRNGDGGRHQRRNRGYTDGAMPRAIAWPERHGGRVRDPDDAQRPRDGRQEGRRGRNVQWGGLDGRGVDAARNPNPRVVQPRGEDRGRVDGLGRRDRRDDSAPDANQAYPMSQAPSRQEGVDGNQEQQTVKSERPQPPQRRQSNTENSTERPQ